MIDRKELALHALAYAKQFASAGLCEATGHNDGVQIDKFEAVWGLQGESWCSMFQYWCYAKAYCDLTGTPYSAETAVEAFKSVKSEICNRYVCFSPSCGTMVDAAKLRGMWNAFKTPEDAKLIKPGYLVIYDWNKTGSPPRRHIGIFDHLELPWLHSGNKFVNVEGNTSSGAGSQDNGDGVYLKHRFCDPGTIMGTIATY
jgi:hypothetical protein